MGSMLPGGIQVVGLYSKKGCEQLGTTLAALRTHLTKLGPGFAPQTLLAASVSWDPDVAILCALLEAGKPVLSGSVSAQVVEDADALLPTAMLTRLTSTFSIAPGDASAALAVLQQPNASFCVISPKEEEAVEKLVLLSSHGDCMCSDLVPAGPAETPVPGRKGAGKGGKIGKGDVEGGSSSGGAAISVMGEKSLLKLEQVWPHSPHRSFARNPKPQTPNPRPCTDTANPVVSALGCKR